MTQIWNREEAERELKAVLAAYRVLLGQSEISGDTSSLVMGEGPVPALVMLIGEAPGAQEVREGRPFVGKAGKQLDAFLAETGLERGQLYVANAVKYRPVKPGRNANRTPGKKEIDMARSLLMAEIHMVQPKIIATLGNSPLYAVTQDKELRIGDVHGQARDWQGHCLFPLYHPASLIYNRSLAETYAADIRKLKDYIDVRIEKDGSS